jgi:RNA polymerase sigma-70 factor (ECF subfamily)
VPEPYRTTLVLRDLEGMSYEEIAELTQVSLGTVKSRLTRGRDALRRLLTGYVKEVGQELGLDSVEDEEPSRESNGDNGLEVTS